MDAAQRRCNGRSERAGLDQRDFAPQADERSQRSGTVDHSGDEREVAPARDEIEVSDDAVDPGEPRADRCRVPCGGELALGRDGAGVEADDDGAVPRRRGAEVPVAVVAADALRRASSPAPRGSPRQMVIDRPTSDGTRYVYRSVGGSSRLRCSMAKAMSSSRDRKRSTQSSAGREPRKNSSG